MVGAATALTRFTPGRRESKVVNVGPGPPPVAGSYIDTFMSEGFVLARNVGYDDCVSRAPAIEAMATPPTSPMRATTVR
jgi:hypothetical protein